VREAKSFCRTCIAQCGVVLTLDDKERIVAVRGDRSHPVSAGYACFKGLQAADTHGGNGRLRHALKKQPNGSFAPIAAEQAFDEIAARLAAIRSDGDPDAIGLFRGTGAFHNATAFAMHGSFLAALGTRSLFTTLSIDQSAKAISACRIGHWQAGRHAIEQSDTQLLFGSNPLVSHSAGGFLTSDPVKRLKREVARGLKLVVVDPRRSETASFAAVHLQPLPGEDVSIAAGMLRIILSEGWYDEDFCIRHVNGLDALRDAVAPFAPDYVAARAGIAARDLHEATRVYATGQRGGVITGTGSNMQPRSNLAEHLAQCIEIVCGRFKRAGDRIPNSDPLIPAQDWYAEVVPPFAPWEAFPPSRIRGIGDLFGEKLTGTLAEEILTPGPGQVRALIVNGANIANSVPGKSDIVAALKALELLVVVDPVFTPTAQLADYVIAPTLIYERADLPITLGVPLHADSWAQYTPAIVPPPPGVVDEWYVFWSLAKRLGVSLHYAGQPLDMVTPPTTEDLLAMGLAGAPLSLDELKRRPDGVAVDPAGPLFVKPARAGHDARFELSPPGVLAELLDVAAEPVAVASDSAAFRLISRRMRDLNGSIGMGAEAIRRRTPLNPLCMNPADMARLALTPGAHVEISSEDGRIRGVVQPDGTLRHGVVSMSHNWGGIDPDPDDYDRIGSSTNALIRTTRRYESLNAMPWMTAIPVRITALAQPASSSAAISRTVLPLA